MKKFVTALTAAIMGLACIGTSACSTDDGKTLYVYTNAGFAPYEYLSETGEVVGVDIDVMNKVGEELGYNVVVNDIDFDQILTEVANNKMAIGAAGMTKKAERDEVANASIPYATSIQYVIVPKGTFDNSDLVEGKLSLSKLSELSNKAIGVQKGTTGSFMVTDAIDGTEDENGNHVTGDLEGSGASDYEYANAIVASQDIGTALGAVVIDKLPAKSIVSANSATLECFELEAEPEQYVLYLNKEATELLAQINTVLDKLIKDGSIDQFTIQHSGGTAA